MINTIRSIAIIIICSWISGCNHPYELPARSHSFDYKKGEAFYNTNNDSAFYYFNKIVVGSKDSMEVAMAYSYMGIIQSAAGDYYGSQESLLQSLKHLENQIDSGQTTHLSDLNELGSVSLSLKNYNAAIVYYDQALEIAQDSLSKLIILSNKAVACQKKQLYTQALAIYSKILEQSKTDIKRYTRLLSNMAFTKWLQDSNYNAAPELLTALRFQEKGKDLWKMNASYAHLSSYYIRIMPDSAFYYASKMYAVATLLSSPDDELEALDKMIAAGSPVVVKQYFNRYRYLNDSLQTSRNNAKNQFALIRFDVAKSKADNLSLQKGNTEKKLQILYQWIIIIAVTASGIGIVLWLKKRRQQMLHEQQLKTSQKVHDVVANGLYRLMMKAEYEENLDKKSLLDDIENLYEKSRNISYEEIGTAPINHSNSISGLLTSFGTPVTRISVVGNSEEIWEKLKPKIKEELTYVLEELMINMKKHSNAHNVVIRFEAGSHALQIHYFDDGKGMPHDFHYNNGLRNTETRMKTLGGSINFDKSVIKGLKIQLSVPIV